MGHRKINVESLHLTMVGLMRAGILLLVVVCGGVPAAAQSTENISLLSVNSAGDHAGNGPSSRPESSADGRFVLFTSNASDLASNDANGSVSDIFVRDLQQNTTTLVSVNAAGTASGNGPSSGASLTPDGRFVVFTSDADDLVPNDTNGQKDVFVRDLVTKTTTLVSVNGAGTGAGDAVSSDGQITPDGRYVVFTSDADDLVVGDTNQRTDVFRRDLLTGTTVLVSVNAGGTNGGDGNSLAAVVTPDGRYVLFGSVSTNLTANDTNGSTPDLFRRDLQTNTTALASINSAGTGSGNGPAGGGMISDDGQVVAFASSSTNLVPPGGSNTGFTDPSIYAHDFAANTTTLISERQVFEGAAVTTPPASSPRISSDGRYVFYVRAENFVPGLDRDGFRDRVFRRDRITGELLELPFVAAPSGVCDQGFNCRSIITRMTTSPDGRYVAYGQQERLHSNNTPFSTAIVIRDMVGGGIETVSGFPGFPLNLTTSTTLTLTPGNIVAGGKLAFSSGVSHSSKDTNAVEDAYLFAPPPQPRLVFNRTNYSLTENQPQNPFSIIRVQRVGYLIDSTVTVQFTTSDGTATAGSDYIDQSGTLTFAPGEAAKSFVLPVINDNIIEPNETVNLTLSNPTGNATLGSPSSATFTIVNDDLYTFQFSAATYNVSETAGSILITVTLLGNTPPGPVSVDYSTSDGTASERSDYITARGKLTFNPGETSKTFRVLLVDDNFVEGDETVNLSLSNPTGTGAVIGSPGTAQLRILDNDSVPSSINPIDDPSFFVRQHYLDFLNREPDTAGFNFWVNQITSCGSDAQCREVKRINVSAAFFLSIEFQQTGLLAYLTNKDAFGSAAAPQAPVPVLYRQFERDTQILQKDFVFGQAGADAQLEANKRAYFDEFVTRPEFVTKFGGMSNADYVSALLASAGLSPTVSNLHVSRLDDSQQVPTSGSSATGLVILRRNPDGSSRDVTISLSLKNLSSPVTAAHLHGPAAAGATAPALLTLPAGEFTDFQVTLTPQQMSFLVNGQLYLDVHTQNHPDGEIRAQLSPSMFRVDVLRNALDINSGLLTRAQVLRIVAESVEFRQAEFRPAFVLMEYFGYLRRDPDAEGYNFWLNKLNAFNGDYIRAEMVKAFINSGEYRQRFGP
jgi:Tol biopolymer transport system component